MIPFRPHKGQVERNLSEIRRLVDASAGSSDLLVFAETVVSGYFVEGGVEEVAQSTQALLDGLGAPAAGAPDVIFGAYELGEDGVRYNATFHVTPNPEAGSWALVHRHRKMFLPTYGLFDEMRFVRPGLEIRSYESRFGRMGMLVCEEMLHSLPPTILALGGAALIVALSASPIRELTQASGPGISPGDPALDSALPQTLERWDVAARAITLEHGIHLALGHLSGTEGGKIFAGGSTVYGPGGKVLGRAPLFATDPLDVPVSFAQGRNARARSPMLEDLRIFMPHVLRSLEAELRGVPPSGALGGARAPGLEGADAPGRRVVGGPDPMDRSPLTLNLPLVERALCTFLTDEVRGRRGFERVVVGVSGGVDSAVTLALAVRTFGAERVGAILLPYRTSSAESLTHGRAVAEALGVRHRTVPISAAVDAYVEHEEPDITPLRRGNLAARFRALVLWDQAAKDSALLLGTGNKSERLLGYYTWHADDSPPINPLGDLLKTQVWALARHLGVPSEIIEKPASADLVEGVHDEDELGVRYDEADLILHWLLEGVTPDALVAAGFPEVPVRRVHGRLASTHWKRRPPTTALLTGTAIGEFYLRPVDF
jgi:NAD+ synthase (glutamine-hydrolysing)